MKLEKGTEKIRREPPAVEFGDADDVEEELMFIKKCQTLLWKNKLTCMPIMAFKFFHVIHESSMKVS